MLTICVTVLCVVCTVFSRNLTDLCICDDDDDDEDDNNDDDDNDNDYDDVFVVVVVVSSSFHHHINININIIIITSMINIHLLLRYYTLFVTCFALIALPAIAFCSSAWNRVGVQQISHPAKHHICGHIPTSSAGRDPG